MHDLSMDRRAVVGVALGGVHHELLPQWAALVVGGRQIARGPQQLSFALAQLDALNG